MVEQEAASGSYSAAYRYTGQELDQEMGLYYYGARYYDPRVSVFLGVDPLAEKYPEWSPYSYTFDNPIRLVDPLGLSPEGPGDPPKKDPIYSGGTLPEVTISAKRRGTFRDHSTESYGYKGSFSDYQKQYGFEGVSYENVSNYYEQVHRVDFDAWVGAQDKAEARRVAVEKMTFWMGVVFPKVATVLTPSGGVGNGGVSGLGLTMRSFNFKSPIASTPKPVHGNSLSSQRPTWFYKLYSNNGTFLKNGITSKARPELRYTRTFMQDKYMSNTRLFPNRRAAYDFEYQQNLILRGPLNLNMH